MNESQRSVTLTVDGHTVQVAEGATILDACRQREIDTPTMCFADNLTPVNACRVCVVELEGSRTLVPACARAAADGMQVRTDSERVRHSRRLVLELLASSVDLSCAGEALQRWQAAYGAEPERFGPPAPDAAPGERERQHAGHHAVPDGTTAATVGQPAKVQDDLYVRDYKRCILCYKCVEACGEDAQNTFAIAVAGRGFDARIATEYEQPLPDSACVYCGNCIGVCPTGALMFKSEFDHRAAGTWDESRQGRDPHRVLLLRRGLQPGAARAGRGDRQGHLARRPLGDPRPPVHQGPFRLPVRAEPPRAAVVQRTRTKRYRSPGRRRCRCCSARRAGIPPG